MTDTTTSSLVALLDEVGGGEADFLLSALGDAALSASTSPAASAASPSTEALVEDTKAAQVATAAALTPQQTTIATTDIALGGNVATALYGVTGAGEKIGIISDSYNARGGAGADTTNGLLPANVTVLTDNPNGTDEGRAMLELAYSIAPGAIFYTADGGSLAQNVQSLQSAGVNVIIDDLSVGGEAFYQIGSTTDIAIQNALAANIDYFTSAGNNGNDYYEHGFTPITTTINGIGTVVANDFGGGNVFQSLTFAIGAPADIQLQWAQPFGRDGTGANTPSNSLAVYLLDAAGNIVASSTVDQTGLANNPSIDLPFTNKTTGTAFRLVVVQNGGTVPAGQLFKYFLNDAIGTINDPNAGKGSGDLLGHELLPGVNVVAAANYANTPAFGVAPTQLESFSSVGPGTILFDANGNALATPITVGEPQFAAPDATTAGTANTNFANSPFFGTSAAAPSAGAVGALILQADTALSTAQVTSVLSQSVIPIATAVGFNGAGLIQARAAVEIAAADAGDRWATAAGGNWNTAASWSGGAPPTNAQTVSLSDNIGGFTGAYMVTVNTADVAGALAISAPAGSSATLTVATGGALAVGGPTAGDRTAGDLLVSDNGVLNVAGGTITETGSLNVNNGTVTVSLGSITANNYAENSGQITIGGGGGGTGGGGLTLTGTGFAETGGTASILASGTLSTTLISGSASSLSIAIGGVLNDSGAATFATGVVLTDSGSFTASSLSLTDDTVTINAGATATVGSLVDGHASTLYTNTLIVSGTLTDTGAVGKGTPSAGGTISLLTGGTFNLGGTFSDVTVDFTGNGLLNLTSTNASTLQNVNSTVADLALNNGAVDYTGVLYNAADSYAYDASSTQLSIFDANGNDAENLFLSGTVNYATQTRLIADATGHLEVVIACYVRGTRILTARGEIAVEDLELGDRLVTTLGRGSALKPVRWLGSRRLNLRCHPHSDKANPVRIRAGALGEGVPFRDLLVSPGHRMAIGGTLICASDLVNGATIVQETPDSVEYWHVELDAHDVILAEGTESESYQDTGNRVSFEAGELTTLHTVLDGDVPQPCLPYAEADAALRETIALRAEALGWQRVHDAAPWLEVDGARIEPARRADRYRFSLPEGCQAAVLRSRAERPRDSSSTDDWRCLGLRLHRIALCGTDHTQDIALGHALLTSGFHAVERDAEGWQARWTTGTAHLPIAALAEGRSVTALEIGIDQGVLFWIAPARPATTVLPFIEAAAISAVLRPSVWANVSA